MSAEAPSPADLRLKLVEARNTLRLLEADLAAHKAAAEQAAIERAGEAGYGRNAEDRARYLTLALKRDPDYQAAQGRLQAAVVEVETLQAEIEIARDRRREVEGERLERLIDALSGRPQLEALVPLDGGPLGGREARP